MCVAHQINTKKQDAFVEKILGSLNYGAMALMTSIGHKTNLFDIMSKLEPSSSQQIADASGLNERYVREWLGAMTVSGVVEYYPETGEYHLPAEHAAVLIKDAGADNLAFFTQYIGLLGTVEDKIVDCFQNGGGLPYSEFEKFPELMSQESTQSVVSVLLSHVIPMVPGLNEQLERGIKVMDLGCGRGKALNLLAKHYPNSTLVGYDLLEEQVNFANNEAAEQGLLNVKFLVKDLTNFDIEDKFDLITTFDAVHDQARPDILLKGIYKTLKDDGVYLMQDISASSEHHKNIEHPLGTLLYTVSTMHCMTVSLAQGGMGLGTMWGRETALEMLNDAGFKNIEIKNLSHDLQNDWYIIRKGVN